MTRSRCSTFFVGSPPSSASSQTSVAGASGCQATARGPVGTPWRGISSETGRSAIVATGFPAASHTSTERAK